MTRKRKRGHVCPGPCQVVGCSCRYWGYEIFGPLVRPSGVWSFEFPFGAALRLVSLEPAIWGDP